ncbi:RagB/SusD family nutrient uptake outer membrane protein [Rhodocytophaga aerolata]|uniref:RagB/SusD family nutrient uptake outer membrane protein n=1 Tax=Rhodocytophaga aerolata TaxID=455078 RepID=A0ABT8RIK6_9BACT|nr:RagB/SusD family nutrient uptake outer membrane protein [Rhodocytophaga aerolata]MDO1451194.1 RagB/SusD family nutrient uptake outer membrane protein [Rhodocytophaga aerolata]
MKTIKYTLFISLLLLGTACKDFLEEDARSLVPTESYYNNVTEASRALFGVYSSLTPVYSSLGLPLASDMAADVFTEGAGGGGSTLTFMDRHTFDASLGILADQYQVHYQLINNANSLLAQLEGRNLGNDAQQNSITGEALFLRALAYFNLVQVFGDVPLRTSPATSTQGLSVPRSSAEEVYAQIIADLEAAAGLLPEEGLAPGRAGRLAAYTLLAKVHLSRQDYLKASQALQPVLGKRRLYGTYIDNFKVANENNKVESIFEVQYGLRPVNSDLIQFMTPNEVTGHGFVYGVFRVEPGQIAAYADNDPRKSTIFWNQVNNRNFDGYYVRKYNDALLPGVQATDAGQVNFPVLRYADVLLMQAEIINGLNGGPTTEAYQALNAVRRRAYGQPVDQPSAFDEVPGLGQAEFLEAVLSERRREFVGEGQRWFDLKRNNLLYIVLADKGFVKGKHEVWPIPQAAIDAEKSLTQNNGY